MAEIAPRTATWIAEVESTLSSEGRKLTTEETALARRVGVQHPERVRVVILREFPLPRDPLLYREIGVFGFEADREVGCSFGYVVVVKPKHSQSRELLAHELAHVTQRERLGAEGFIHQYLLELRTLGYTRSLLEREARRAMAEAKRTKPK